LLTNKTLRAPAALSEVTSKCGSTEACLQIVDAFFESQPRTATPAGMVQTYGAAPPSGGGPCGALCELRATCLSEKCRYDPYDNAVVAIYLSRRGKLDDAQRILDALTFLLYPGGQRQLELLYAAYHVDGSVEDYRLDTGNNAWVGMAFAHYAAASGKACYAAIAREIMGSISGQTECKDGLGGFMGRMPRGVGRYRATEHNIDMYALGRMLGNAEVQETAHRFVSQMYGANPEHPTVYATGTEGSVECDTTVGRDVAIAADAQFWNMLAQADDDLNRKRASMEYALRDLDAGGMIDTDKDILGDGSTLKGILFSHKGHGAQWENTAAVVMAVGMYDAIYGERADFKEAGDEMESSLRYLLGEYGTVLASVNGGNYEAWRRGMIDTPFPGGSDTGLGWTYLRYPHSAATAWTGLVLLQVNPFAPTPVPATSGLDLSCIAPR